MTWGSGQFMSRKVFVFDQGGQQRGITGEMLARNSRARGMGGGDGVRGAFDFALKA